VIIDREVRVLFGKEWRQLVSARSALATGAILPIMMLGFVPGVMSLAARAPAHAAHPDRPLDPSFQIGLLGDLSQDPRHLAGSMMPIFVAIVGMVLPTMMASYLLITERERRTLELLVALPVRIEQVMVAKLLATLAASCAMSVPMLIADMIWLPLAGAASVEQVAGLPVLLVAGLTLSTSIALLMSLLAKDFRTANNIGGAMLAPTIILTLIGGMLMPGGVARPLGISLVYFAVAFFVMRHALKTVTFERLLA
jgi:ABC-2 type transport system permease protein